ncbi:MAG TPA: hypothetical protein VFD43_07705, partial [Planctomycetota bacterium]|nr:hypothetical protein [Planctomycetota bacterium]
AYSLDSERTGSNVEIWECVWPTVSAFGSGFGRELAITSITPGFPPRGTPASLGGLGADEVAWMRVSVGAPSPAELVDSFGSGNHDSRRWQVYRRPDGVIECVGVRLVNYHGPRQPVLLTSEGRLDVFFVPEATEGPGSKLEDTVEILRVFGTTWSPDLRQALDDSR